eukprot:m51a1_g1740 hypothetical protein (561) ;mRNA; r:179625-183466
MSEDQAPRADPVALTDRAVALFDTGAFDAARDALLHALAAAPEFVPALLLLRALRSAHPQCFVPLDLGSDYGTDALLHRVRTASPDARDRAKLYFERGVEHTPLMDFLRGSWLYFMCAEHKAAAEIWEPLAKRGVAPACASLGYCYDRGVGTPQDISVAVKLYRKAADLGHVHAMCNLVHGHVDRQLPEHGLRLCGGAVVLAPRADPVALTDRAVALFDTGAFDAARDALLHALAAAPEFVPALLLLRALRSAHPQCFVPLDLGSDYGTDALLHRVRTASPDARDRAKLYFERGVEHTPLMDFLRGSWLYFMCAEHKAAAEIWEPLAKRGVAPACASLGYCYDRGVGTPQDISVAVKLYRKAADLGHVHAMCNLGVCYEMGDGVEKDVNKALRLYRHAADSGLAHGLCCLAWCYSQGSGVPVDKGVAARLYRLAAAQGDTRGLHNLGVLLEHGSEGVECDPREAVRMYRAAAELDDADAQYAYGLCLLRGVGTEQDIATAVKFFALSAAQGNDRAAFQLGEAYALGLGGLPQDVRRAASLWAAYGNRHSQVALRGLRVRR